MPRLATDYSKCVIYKIQHKDDDTLLYVGHTTDFIKRKSNHKKRSTNETEEGYGIKLYQMIRQNGGWNMCNMVVVKVFPCENKRQAESEEDRMMREYKANMNSRHSVLDLENVKDYKKRYNIENKEYIQEQKKQYRVEHKDEIQENKRRYYEQNKEYLTGARGRFLGEMKVTK